MIQKPTLKILIIDDELSIQNLLKINLESNGYKTLIASNAKEGIQKALTNNDLSGILIDLGLPDQSGLETIIQLRNSGVSIPILVLTVLDQDEKKVLALDSGADDYITKPFSIPELLARIRVALRHSKSTLLLDNEIIVVGPIEMNPSTHQILINRKELKVTPIEFQILIILGQNKGRVVTHHLLLNKIWGPNATEYVQYLRVHLGQIRKKLKLYNASEYLVTESGIGYRLLTELSS